MYGSSKWGVPLGGQVSTSLISYVDSDWAGDEVDRKSTAGNVLFYKACPISWGSKKIQSTVSLSSTEAEVHAMVDGMKSILHIQPIISEIGYSNPEQFSVIIGDNLPAMHIVMGSHSTKKAKHFDVRVKFAMDMLEQDNVGMNWIATARNLADIFTKPSATPWFREFREATMVTYETDADALNRREISFIGRFSDSEKQSGVLREMFRID